jgi:hypothetical protein
VLATITEVAMAAAAEIVVAQNQVLEQLEMLDVDAPQTRELA